MILVGATGHVILEIVWQKMVLKGAPPTVGLQIAGNSALHKGLTLYMG